MVCLHDLLRMPVLSKHALLQANPKRRSRKNSAATNKEFKEHGLKYSTASTQSSVEQGLRGLKQILYPELCAWSSQRCWKYLMDHGVLSDEPPLCYSCLEQMARTSRLENASFACGTKGCYAHPAITWPREAFTPLHGQARQSLVL